MEKQMSNAFGKVVLGLVDATCRGGYILANMSFSDSLESHGIAYFKQTYMIRVIT